MANFTPINVNGWRFCQRCNTRFDSTIPFTYVRGKDGSGRSCCPSCTEHYEGRKAAEQVQHWYVKGFFKNWNHVIDFTAAIASEPSRRELVKAMSAAQRGDNAFPNQRFSNPPLPSFGQAGKMLPPPVPPHALGYTPNHAVHQLHQSKMAQAASSGRFHQVMIRVALHHLKPEGKSGTVLVGVCYISSNLMILYDPRQPSLRADEPVLQDFFLRATAKDPTPKFYANARVAILLVMTNAQFEEVLLWQEQHHVASTSVIPTKKKKTPQSQGSDNLSPSLSPSRPARKRFRMCRSVESPVTEIPCDVSKDNEQFDTNNTQFRASKPVTDHGGDSSTPESQPISRAEKVFSQLFLPSASQLQAAMQAQGSIREQASSISAGCTSITFRLYDIPSIGFADLVHTPFNIDSTSQYTVVTLTIDTSPKSMIGSAGSFKTCHPALLSNKEASESLLLSVLSAERLVAKRVFFRKGQGQRRHRYAREDELSKTLDEVNCLYWGTALLGMAYTFIDEMLGTGNVSKEVEGQLPRLRLVRAALAIPDDSTNDLGATYLVEERISGKFVKYINNNSAVPADSLEGREAVVGLFLCFVQHIQFHLTNNVVYLSDFQGSGDLLTDCQVLTGFLTGAFANNFGSGNSTSAFNGFKFMHKCNKFCRIFGLQPYST
ncbi:hypothetical protein EDD22DRAFT_783730 [Suillus occidentalis]|nr:hypothetical protein EDD22DRAFT_783730 [Suillus occidentalis]